MNLSTWNPLLAVAVASVLATPTPAARAVDGAPAALSVKLTDVHSSSGKVICLLFNSPDGFPEQVEKAYRVVHTPISGSNASCEFTDISAGTYAVLAMHDENDNDKMDKNVFGIPKEGYVASNNVHHAMSPPTFQEASFSTTPGAVTALQLHMRY